MTSRRTYTSLALAGALVLTASSACPRRAQAQEADPVSPTGKGIAGGILLGAEVPMITLAIIGVDEWWAYLLAGGIGAGGGAVGGYFVETTGEAEPALYMLAGGMALVIPTVVATLDATAYEPGKDEEDESDVPGEDAPEGTEPAPLEQAAPPAGAVLGVDPNGIRLGAPAVHVQPSYSSSEVAQYGLEQQLEWNIPIARGSF